MQTVMCGSYVTFKSINISKKSLGTFSSCHNDEDWTQVSIYL